ncbi:MAG: alpha/beta hydrolase [Anaerolineaceae bacterium]|nr:alpha/beta hydrolase [Anaerolineaceae bacterium]
MVLYYVQFGEGLPLVLLHGFPFDHTVWNEVIRKLEKGVLVITPDLRGHGRSIVATSDYSITNMAEDVIELMNQLHIEEAVIAGHSMGGYVALEIARNFPERVSGLALIASHIFSDSLEKKQSRSNTINKILQQGVSSALLNMPDLLTNDKKIKTFCREAVERMNLVGAVGALNAMKNRLSSENVWEALNIPTMVVAGVDDQLIPIEKSRRFAALPGCCILEEINNAGHMLMVEAPDRVAAALVKFVNQVQERNP